MTADATRASHRPPGIAPEAALARCRGPAWLIDPAMGRVLAANALGAARLGLRPDAACGTLDAAMPGLQRLRALMREPLEGERREPLIFWTAYGAESLDCDVRALTGPASRPLALVSIAGTGQEPPAPGPAVALASAPAPSAEDAATMQRIARAIRTGIANPKEARADAGGAADAEAPAEPVSHVSKLAHELKTPLSAIMVAAEIMRDERFGTMANARYRGYTADIHDNARHALAVINRLLGAGGAEDAGLRLEAVPLDLNALAQSSVSAMRPLAEGARLKLVSELHAPLPRVIADAMTVKQILFNLLTNAVKFTKPGGKVRLVTGFWFDGSVFIAVRDTGPGMSPEEIARVLDAKAPPRPARKEAGGLGIGLPLAVGLAKANGARLEIGSEPGEGTAVALIFPKDRLAPEEPRA